MCSALCDRVRENTDTDLKEHGTATLVLSGGKTPNQYLHELSKCRRDWSKVSITLSDERFVDKDHEDSNEALIAKYFSDTDANLIGLRGAADVPASAANNASISLLGNCRWPASVSILGFGLDGHFASLFSHEDCENSSPGPIIVTRKGTSSQTRLSMSFDFLQKSKNLIFVCSDRKLHFLNNINNEKNITTSPLRYFLNKSGSEIDVYSFMR